MITEFILAGVSFFQPQAQQDSLGIETVNGKVFVIHKVSEKETLYGISKRYGATVDAVLEFNPSATEGLEIGQILKVPYSSPKTPVSVRPTGGGIIHVVAPKETMFSISKAYGVSIDEIKQWNDLSDNSISIGQELSIKKRNTQSGVSNVTTTSTVKSNDATPDQKGAHTVAAKETMYSIARQYNITVDQLRAWNGIEGNELKIGQVLHVSQPGQPVAVAPVVTPRENPVVVTQTPKEKESQEVTPEPPAQQQQATTATTTPAPKVETPKPTIIISESTKNGDEVLESGLAELIAGTEGNRKYLALHRTAPVGTILKVKNEMNSREVFVRVTGKLPDTALSDKLVIKISKSAYDRLGAIDPRFRVQVTYYK
jgi:LysM repeat protein